MSKKLRIQSSVYPENPCKTYKEWAKSVLRGAGKMRTHEYVSMLDRERK